VIDHLLAKEPGLKDHEGELLAQAQESVRWHYQWIVVKDFLPKVVGDNLATAALNGELGDLPVHSGTPFMPVEFSGAAYRFGHSMVRENYVLNDAEHAVGIFGPAPRDGAHLGGRRALRPNLEIEWKHFFDTTPTPPANRAMRIDPFLVAPLRHVPPRGQPLALLNLQRGVALELPDARAVAEDMGVPELDDDQLIEPLRVGRTWEFRDALLRATPLWYYVLCEAMLLRDGRQLGPLGGGIVAKVLGGLLRDDPASWVVKKPDWKPDLPRGDDDTFTMVDLVNFAQS
jgi:Animal haem peroxidase